jgi:hypothetical protein
VMVEDTAGPLTISAVYLPPRHSIQQEELLRHIRTQIHSRWRL